MGPRAWFRTLWEPAAVVLLSSVAFVLGFGGGWGRLSTPLGTGDMLPTYLASRVWGDGSPFGNDTFGYPFGVELRYYPTIDFVQNFLAGVGTALTGNPFLGMNAVFALSFPMTALAAWWVLRITRIRGPIAVLMAVALTVIPYHWLRIEHVYLGTMYSAVLGVGLALLVGTGEIQRRARGPRRWWQLVLLIGLGALIAWSGVYYAFFAVLLCGTALVYRVARGSGWRGLLVSSLPAVVVATLTAAALVPAWYYERTHPALEAVADRFAWESVFYSGIFTNVLLPAPFSQVPGFGAINDAVTDVFVTEADIPTAPGIGVLWYANFGSLFTVLAMIVFAAGVVWVSRRRARGAVIVDEPGDVRFGLVGLLLAVTILFFVPWGLNFLFAYVVTGQLRGWDRLVPVIFTLVFVGAGVALRQLNLARTGARASAVAGLLVVLLVLDSVLPYRANFDAASATGNQNALYGRTYAAAVNDAIPGRCGVVQLPHIGYPEQPSKVDLASYAHLWVALTNPEKNWTFGSMKRTLGDAWLEHVGDSLDTDELGRLADGGFCAVHLDLRGYTEEDGAIVAAELSDALGDPVATGHDGQWLAFAITEHSEPRRMDEATLAGLSDDLQVFYAPPAITPTEGLAGVAESDPWHERWWLTSEPAVFTVTSIEDDADFETIEFEMLATECVARDVAVTLTAGSEAVEQIISLDGGESQKVVLTLDSPTTEAQLSVEVGLDIGLCLVPDGRYLSVAVIDPVAAY